MEDWEDDSNLVNAYIDSFDEAYGSDDFRGFLEVMEKRMTAAVEKHVKDKMAWDDTLEQIMADAEDHFAEMNAKYAEMQ